MDDLMLDQTERRLVWILGSPRSGSTWLMNVLSYGGATRINEPAIGAHLGVMPGSFLPIEPYGRPVTYRLDQFRSDDDYFFSAKWEHVWRPPVRGLILRRGQAQTWEARHPNGKEAKRS